MEVDNEVNNFDYCRNNSDEEAWTYRDDTCISGDLGIIIFDFLRRVKRCIKRLKELYCE